MLDMIMTAASAVAATEANAVAANADAAPAPAKSDAFEVGKVYGTRSICDQDTIFSYEVLKRTAKSITLRSVYRNGHYGEPKRRGVYVYDGIEYCKPEGTYSMCPVINATKAVY